MRIALFGCAGTNLGDNAIAEVICRYLVVHDPNVLITLWSIAPERLSPMPRVTVRRLDRRSWRGWWQILRTLWWADRVLIGGGTMVQDRLGISMVRGVLPYATQIAILAGLMRRPVFFAGVGADELGTSLGRRLTRLLLRRVSGGFVRDLETLQRLRLVTGEQLERLTVGDDPALLLEPLSMGNEAGAAPAILVSLALDSVPEAARRPLLDWIADAMQAGAQRLGTRDIGFILMDDREDEDGRSFAMFGEILAERGLDITSIRHFRPQTASAAQALLRNCRLLIAMRLHALILAVGHVPILAISRSEKTHAFTERCKILSLNAKDTKLGPTTHESLLREAMKEERLAEQRLIVLQMCHAASQALDDLNEVLYYKQKIEALLAS